MIPTLLLVTYRLRIPAADFRAHARAAAERIASAPGLAWKIWGLNDETGFGTSAHLFHDAPSAKAFADGPAIAELRDGPAADVVTRIAPVHVGLSFITGAAQALGLTETIVR